MQLHKPPFHLITYTAQRDKMSNRTANQAPALICVSATLEHLDSLLL
jgi:hypothetical protein